MFLLFFLLSTSNFHALYLSTCEVVVHDDQTWEAQLRIFFDDLEDAITNHSGYRPNLVNDQIAQHQPAISAYLNEHLFFVQGNSKITFQVTKAIRNQDVVEINLQSRQIWPDKSILVKNNLLMEIFEAQKNVMVIKKGDEIRTLYFKKTQVEEEVFLGS